MNLRDTARGEHCTIRLEGICNFDPDTTVLCHYRISGISGMGLKVPDLIAAYGCSACHDAVDRRTHLELDRDHVRMAHLHGVLRTQQLWLDRGWVVYQP